MPTITCPSCRVKGPSESGSPEFETRGQWKGKPVRKCRACGAGMTVRLGFTGVKTNQIEKGLWSRMEQEWNTNGPGRPGAAAETQAQAINWMLGSGRMTEEEAERLRAGMSFGNAHEVPDPAYESEGAIPSDGIPPGSLRLATSLSQGQTESDNDTGCDHYTRSYAIPRDEITSSDITGFEVFDAPWLRIWEGPAGARYRVRRCECGQGLLIGPTEAGWVVWTGGEVTLEEVA